MKTISLTEHKKICLENKVPIMRDFTINHLTNKIKKINNKVDILEIGTGQGYSSRYIVINSKNVNSFTSIEHNENNFKVANKYNNESINYILSDCFNYETDILFDVIILDGPKSKMISLFNKYIFNLKDNGVMFVDNLILKKIRSKEKRTNNQNKIIESIDAFNDFLKKNTKYKTEIYTEDDGFCYIERK